MTKKATVALHGFQKRGVQVDLDATDGATVGKNLRWPDGTLVTQQQIINNITTVITPGGTTVAATLWELILNIPAFIASLAALVTSGFVVRDGAGAAQTRTIVGETGRIEITDGDGLTGNPTVVLGPWPTVLPGVELGDTARVPAGHQMLVWDNFEVVGDLDIEAGAELVILADQPPLAPINPDFTYSSGALSQIDYDGGEQKLFTYNGGGQLEQLDYIADGVTLRKLFFYTGGGDLDYITQEYL